MEIDRLRKLLEATGMAPREGEAGYWQSWRTVLSNGQDNIMANSNVYLIVQVYVDGKDDVKVSGSPVRIAHWLELEHKSGKGKITVDVIGLGTDRNWARAKADEV